MEVTTFYGLELATVPGLVMTPRPASEQLVDAVVDRLVHRPAVVADVGTGSGAIGVAIAASAPQVHVWATDSSRYAVQLARANVRRHGLGDRVTVLEGDLLDRVPGRVDVIVANLPYVSLADAALYADLKGEPAAAVFAPGDGLEHYRRLVATAHARLMPEGALIIQLHRRVLVAERTDLDLLAAKLTEQAPPTARPRRAAAGPVSL
jgi:release factor glutamine methyltransferase